MNDNARWFALKVRHQHEASAAAALARKDLAAFVPMTRQRRRWMDRVKGSAAPLFPAYVFCRFEYVKRLTVLNTPGVLSIVGLGNGPSPLPDEEIAALRTALDSGHPLEPCPYLIEGEQVEINRGPLKKLRGVLVRSDGKWRVVLSVGLLMLSAAVEVDPSCVTTLAPATIRSEFALPALRNEELRCPINH